jgi:bidirectional [NiFe] hydrogenase diaphorase subunit
MVIDDLIEIGEKERAACKPHVIRCCMAAGCMSSNSKAVKEGLEKAVREAGLQNQVEVRGVGCMRLCCQGPLVQVDPGQSLYQKVTPEDATALVAMIGSGASGQANSSVQADGQAPGLTRGDPNHPFFTEQLSIVLANSGYVDPERIESYIAAEGYHALHDVLREKTPKEVVETLIQSGLRGRGGAGYPTGLK